MGTSCGLFAVDQDAGRLVQGEFWVRRLAARLTRFSADSEISKLNAAAGQWVPVSPELESLLQAALRAHEMSAGMVNVSVLPSMIAIGYTRTMSEGPGAVALDEARPIPALPDVLSVRDGEARVGVGAGVDLGGIAKGWMADRLVEILGPNSLANLGGDLCGRGPGPGGGGWPVGMAGTTLMLRDQGAATSSVRKRRWGLLHHLIDPRTGLPSDGALNEVAVVAASGFDAEVIAKTALLLGPELAPAYCASHASAWWLGGSF
jgi:thiamine biosynthesis lipoprotein